MSRYVPAGHGLPVWRRPAHLRPALERCGPEFGEFLRCPVCFLQGFVSWEGEPIRLDGWQRAMLMRRHRFRAFEKSVQIGFSWLCAAEAFHRAFIYEDDESSFVSISENEAKNKVQYVRKLHDGLAPWLASLVPVPVRSREEIWFGSEGRPSIIRSLPASGSLRGRATHVYVDEIDHFRPGQDKEILPASIGRVTRASRRLTIGSSVFGEETVLSSIMRRANPGEETPYPDFLKGRLPWWVSENESARETIDLARRNMPPDDFAQEYECVRSNVANSLFPQDFIRAHWHEHRPLELKALEPKAPYLAGYDPGATGNPPAIAVFASGEQVVLELWRGKSLTEQERSLEQLLERCQGLTLAIDPGGLGKQMSDHLEEQFGARVVQVTFTQASKHDMALNLRRMLEEGRATILHDVDLAHQMNRTRKLPGAKIEQPGMGKRSHYDQFWAVALALSLASGEGTSIYDSQPIAYLDLEPV